MRREGFITLGGAVVALLAFVASLLMGRAGAHAWLGAVALWAGAAAGAIALSMMLRLIPGSWRDSLHGPLTVTPLMLAPGALAILPLVAAPGWAYPWAGHPSGGAFREAWLSPLFFLARTVVWFAVLAFLAWRLPKRPHLKGVSAVGLIVWTIWGGFIAMDWLMSLDPDFASSGFGLYALSIWLMFALALAIVRAAPRADPKHLDVIGGVLLTAVILWAYLGFMQYLILWSGDLKPGAAWFRMRAGPWTPLGWAPVALKMIPGFALIFGHVRRNVRALQTVAGLIALGAVPELAWLTLPAEGPPAGFAHILVYLLAVAGLGACSFGLVLQRREAQA